MSPVVEELASAAVSLGLTAGELKSSTEARDQVVQAAHAGYVRQEQWRDVVAKVDLANDLAARGHRQHDQCKACGQPVRWVKTETGKSMSLDPLPRPRGNVILLGRARSKLTARVLPPSALPVVGRPAYQAHIVSCPFADQFRKHRSKPSITKVLCPVCREPLHRLNVEAGIKIHPLCEEDPS